MPMRFRLTERPALMKLVLTALDAALAAAWEAHCQDLDCVELHRGSILEVACDAVVSPANSYGIMDGGIDATYHDHFGEEVELAVRRMILEHYAGELLVGAADIVETGAAGIPYLIAAPTMRVPMKLVDSVNAYLAARAVILLVKHGRFRSGPHQGEPIAAQVQRVALPGLGTGAGGIPYEVCAKQVRRAIDDFLLGGYRLPRSWAEASERHQLLYSDKPRDLQR